MYGDGFINHVMIKGGGWQLYLTWFGQGIKVSLGVFIALLVGINRVAESCHFSVYFHCSKFVVLVWKLQVRWMFWKASTKPLKMLSKRAKEQFSFNFSQET